MEKGFFASLFDFSFQSFITTKLIPILYALGLLGVLLVGLVLIFRGGASVIGGIFVLVFGAIYVRVILETTIVFFRIAEHTRDTANALRSPDAPPPASPPAPPAEVV
jgi:hypothetical protein